jgi:hypothetical protein
MELTAEHYRRAAIAYDAYCKQTGLTDPGSATISFLLT